MRSLIYLCVVSLCFGMSSASSSALTLPAGITAVVQGHGLPVDAYAIWVQRPGEETPTLAWNADRHFNPASTVKLGTTLAGLAVLGPQHTWSTRIYARGTLEDDVLRGDLVIVGSGDPGMVSEEHWRMLGDLRRTGLRRIDGDILVDTGVFELGVEDPGAFDRQPFRAYNQPPHAFQVNGNSLRFHVLPGRGQLAGNGQLPPVRVVADPPLPGLEIVNRIRPVVQGGCDHWQRGLEYGVESNGAGMPVITFSGDYPVHCGDFSMLRAALPVLAYQEKLFRLHWGQWGGEFTGRMRYRNSTESFLPEEPLSLLIEHSSRPLGDLIRVINKWSANAATRQLALTLGQERYGNPASIETARAAILDTLSELGVDTQGMWIDNGAGLSRDVRMSARQLGAILDAGWQSAFRPEFVSSLAIAGLDGTLRSRFAEAPERGRMHLKTGRLNDVAAVAGYVRSASGQDFLVVVLVNHPQAHRGPGQELHDAVLRWVHAQ
jgi:D-alanyl-D-alanine carboxypeptidase/D-alanyl-D-alanine-endopeptidase (penicillin-binding protein 4)